MIVRVKHVNKVKDRYGNVRYYHRKSGERLDVAKGGKRRTPEEIAARAAEINEGYDQAPAPSPAPGTMAALIEKYRASPDYLGLKPKTRHDYGRILDDLKARTGDDLVVEVTREDVIEMRDALAATPRTADLYRAVVSRLLGYATDFPRQFGLEQNPALRIRKLHKTDGYPPWPADLVDAVRRATCDDANAAVYPELLWAIELGLYTGQRQGDCLRMEWRQIDAGMIAVKQDKTGEQVWIPAHPSLKATLAVIPKRSTRILTSRSGRPWAADYFRHQVAAATAALGREGYVFAGLRKNAANALAEAGCSEHEIQAITGHRTADMVRHYTRKASKKRLAKAAIAKLSEHRNKSDD